MPALGIAQETGKLLQWMKAEGEAVKKGDVLMVVETDKTTVEIEADASGILSNVTIGVGQEAPVGQVIALILAPGESRHRHRTRCRTVRRRDFHDGVGSVLSTPGNGHLPIVSHPLLPLR